MIKNLLIILFLVQSYIYATNIELDDVIMRYIASIQELKRMASGHSKMNDFVVASMALEDLKKLCELDSYVIHKLESKMMLQNMGLIDSNCKIYQFVKDAFKRMIINNEL